MSRRTALSLSLLLLSLSAIAQDRGDGGKMPVPAGGVTGFVSSVNGNIVTVLNGAISIDTTGAVFHNRKGPGSIADVKPGVQIVAMIKNPEAGPGTMLQASNVTVLDLPAGFLTGPIQSVDVAGNTLTLFGARLRVTANTRIVGSRDQMTLAQLKAGDNVSVEVSINGASLIAETIHVYPPIPNASLDGTVKSIGSTSWVITTRNGDVTVTVTNETKIDPSVKVGDVVHVVGNADASGQITAVAIHGNKPRPTPPPSDLSVEGTVKSIGAAAWVITTRKGEVTVTVTPETKIDPTVKVGDSVVVIGRPDAAGNIVAVSIVKRETKTRTTRG